MFRADMRRSESFHTFLIMGEFSDLIGLQSEIWPAMADSELKASLFPSYAQLPEYSV
jgi:hypothetical protein